MLLLKNRIYGRCVYRIWVNITKIIGNNCYFSCSLNFHISTWDRAWKWARKHPLQVLDFKTYLKAGTKFDEYTGFLVPHEYQTNSSVNNRVDAHGTDLEWHFSSRWPLDDIRMSIAEHQLVVLGQEMKKLETNLKSHPLGPFFYIVSSHFWNNHHQNVVFKILLLICFSSKIPPLFSLAELLAVIMEVW